MNDSSRSMDVLRKLLKNGPETPQAPEELLQEYFAPPPLKKTPPLRPGRPRKEEHLKARNFTLCLDPKYLKFLDQMTVRDKKVQGRGRKVRFIIDQFVELHRRQRTQLETLVQSLGNVEKVLGEHAGEVKKGKKLELSTKEKTEISLAVNQVQILIRVLAFTPKELHRLLPRNKWDVVAFCMDWTRKMGDKG